MCIIIDNNVVSAVFLNSNPDFRDLHASLFSNRNPQVRIFYGGTLRDEYLKNGTVRKLLALLDRAGRAVQVTDGPIEAEELIVKAMGLCVSNDIHVIALARASGVRLLCSHDIALHNDFTNGRLINRPRGRVYQNTSHNHLLTASCGR